MKLYKLIVLSLFLSSNIIGQSIEFTTTDYASAITKAKETNRLIFVDAYTTWCGPCKYMAKEIFTDKNVGEYYNSTFVNFKIDMEKGEGPALAKKWEITGYPTLIFIDGNGDVIHRSMGSRPAEDFIDLGKAAVDPDRQITTMTKRFEAGERDADFLKKYTDAMTSAGLKGFDKIAQMYMDTQSDWGTPESINFIFDYSDPNMDSKLFQYSLENKDAFIAVIGKDKWDQKIDYTAEIERSKAGISRDDIEKLKTHYGQFFDASKAEERAMITYFKQLMYSQDPVDQEKFKAEVQLFLAPEPDLGWSFYNSVAWQIFEISTERDVLEKASRWTTISIEEDTNSYNTDTKAHILHKLGDNAEAKTFAEKSIALAKEEGADYSATQELLEKIGM